MRGDRAGRATRVLEVVRHRMHANKHAHAGSRTRVTSMGGLYDTATLHALVLLSVPLRFAHGGLALCGGAGSSQTAQENGTAPQPRVRAQGAKHPKDQNDPGRTRTCNLWFRRPTPYPLGRRATARQSFPLCLPRCSFKVRRIFQQRSSH